MELLLQQAYTKLKSHLYSDKTLLAEKIELAQFEANLENNLKAMQTIGNAFHVTIGYSDHTNGIEVPIAAVAMGAMVIEKHFTLDKTMEGPDHKASLEPHELIAMVKAVRNVEKAMGNGMKKPSHSETKNILAGRKSIVASKPIKKGEVFSNKNLTAKKPRNGTNQMKALEHELGI